MMNVLKMPVASRLRLLALCLPLVVQGCSYQGWYTGLQEQQRRQCYREKVNTLEVQQCLDRINGTTYDQYKAQREEALKAAR